MDGLFTRDSSKDVKARMDVSILVIKLTFNIKPLFIQKNVKMWLKMDFSPIDA